MDLKKEIKLSDLLPKRKKTAAAEAETEVTPEQSKPKRKDDPDTPSLRIAEG